MTMIARSSPRLADIVSAVGLAYRNVPASRASLDVLETFAELATLLSARLRSSGFIA
jgi:hypothetical protein